MQDKKIFNSIYSAQVPETTEGPPTDDKIQEGDQKLFVHNLEFLANKKQSEKQKMKEKRIEAKQVRQIAKLPEEQLRTDEHEEETEVKAPKEKKPRGKAKRRKSKTDDTSTATAQNPEGGENLVDNIEIEIEVGGSKQAETKTKSRTKSNSNAPKKPRKRKTKEEKQLEAELLAAAG